MMIAPAAVAEEQTAFFAEGDSAFVVAAEPNGELIGYSHGFDFGATAATSFGSTASRDLVLNPLLSNTIGTNLVSQPDDPVVRTELNALIDRLTVCGGSCPSDRTPTVVKAACAAALGNAVTLIQ